MKNFFGFLLALLLSGTLAAQAQTTPAAHPTHAPKADHMPAGATAASQMDKPKMDKSAKMKMAKTNSTGSMMPGAGPMKKDGTPDMRYKANKMRKM